MSMTDQQWEFLKDFGRLIMYAIANGYKLTEAEGKRTDEQAWLNALPAETKIEAHTKDGQIIPYPGMVGGAGIQRSLHKTGLAVDVNLILPNGTLAESVEDYRPLGEYWKSLNPLNRWGGDFIHPRPDGDHFERQPV